MGKQSEDLEFVIDLLVNLGKFMVLFHVLICKLEQLSSSQGYSGPVRQCLIWGLLVEEEGRYLLKLQFVYLTGPEVCASSIHYCRGMGDASSV